MTEKDKYMTQGMGLAINYAWQIDEQFASMLFSELAIPLTDYEDVCDPVDLPNIRNAAS